MTVSCPSCQAQLRLSEKIQASGATSARCPKCQQTVPLNGSGSATPHTAAAGAADSGFIRVACPGCGVQLKASASRAGSRSKCPRCATAITIGTAPEAPSGMAARDQEESSGAATRRIDSRLLGPTESMAQAGLGGPAPHLPGPGPIPGAGMPRPQESRSVATDLMGPPPQALRSAAHDIMDAAHSMDPTLPPPSKARPEPVKSEAPAARPEPKPSPLRDLSPRTKPAREEAEEPAAPQEDRPYPVWRGVMAGTVAGALVGGALWGMNAGLIPVSLPAWLVSPVPVSMAAIGVPDPVMSFLFVVVLSMMVGLTASAAGTPTVRDKPLGFLRCAAIALLTGLALGAATSAFSGGGLGSWPPWAVLSWGRDMLATGLLTAVIGAIVSPRLR